MTTGKQKRLLAQGRSVLYFFLDLMGVHNWQYQKTLRDGKEYLIRTCSITKTTQEAELGFNFYHRKHSSVKDLNWKKYSGNRNKELRKIV